jgi:hypothetical protein
MYDTAADRWFASHFVGGSDGATFWQCFAVLGTPRFRLDKGLQSVCTEWKLSGIQ